MSDTDDLIRRARDLLDGITPGPWRAEPRAAEYYDLTTVYNVFHNGDTWDRDLVASVAYDNAEFIAAAPELVAGLLAEVERLRDVRKQSRRAIDTYVGALVAEKSERDSAVAAVERAEALADRWENAAAAFGISDSELDAAAFDLRRALGGAS